MWHYQGSHTPISPRAILYHIDQILCTILHTTVTHPFLTIFCRKRLQTRESNPSCADCLTIVSQKCCHVGKKKYCNSIVLEYFSYFCTSGWSNAAEMRSELKTIRIKCSKVISFLINFTVIFASESNQD